MTVKQGLVVRGVAFLAGAVLFVVVLELVGRSLVALVMGGTDADVDGVWTGVRMAGYSVAFVLLMLSLGRFGAAATYQGVADEPTSEPAD